MPNRLQLAFWPRPVFSKVVIRSSSFILGMVVWLVYIYSNSYSAVDQRSSASNGTKMPAIHDPRDSGALSRQWYVQDLYILRRPTVPTFEGMSLECDPTSSSKSSCSNNNNNCRLPLDKLNVTRSGDYVVLNNLITRQRQFAFGESITLTTHATYDLLDNVVELGRRWQGPISVAVYAPGDDFQVSVEYALWLRNCHQTVADFVTFHFVLPADEKLLESKLRASAERWCLGTAAPSARKKKKVAGARKAATNSSSSSSEGTSKNKLSSSPPPGPPAASGSKHYHACRRVTLEKMGQSNSTTTATITRTLNYTRVLKTVAAKCGSSSSFGCAENESFPLPAKSYRARNGLLYPINVCRNVARRNARTHFVLASDIELYPSARVIPWFLEYCRASGILVAAGDKTLPSPKEKNNKKKAAARRIFVLPIFEVDKSVKQTPESKMTLVELYRRKKAVYFHKHVCSFCNIIPKLNQWLLSPSASRNKLGTFVVTKRHRPFNRWEPIYIGTNNDPLYEEGLTWEGQQDKMTQMYELCLMNYDLAILDNAFLVHRPGIKMKNVTEYQVKSIFIAQNNKIYEETVRRLEKRHGVNSWCK